MAKKTFAMLNTSILHVRAFRELVNCFDRNLYFTAHLSAQANFCGLFRYPVSLIADETKLSIPDVRASLARLCHAGLIEYDPDAELIRICGWFRSANCPKNADHTRQVARHFVRWTAGLRHVSQGGGAILDRMSSADQNLQACEPARGAGGRGDPKISC